MIALALRLALGAFAGASPPPPPVAYTRAELAQDYQDCLDDHDLTPEDNDGECEEP